MALLKNGSRFIGCAVAKKFEDGKTYRGKVDRYDGVHKLWHVTYNDGDEEEFNANELQAAIKLQKESSVKPKAPTKPKKNAERNVTKSTAKSKSAPKERTTGFREVKESSEKPKAPTKHKKAERNVTKFSAKSTPKERTAGYSVEEESHPSGNGRHVGEILDGDEEEFDSKDLRDAIKLQGESSSEKPKAPTKPKQQTEQKITSPTPKPAPKEPMPAPEEPIRFRVVKESYPSGNGCYAGQIFDRDYIDAVTSSRTIGTYDTRAEANKVAWNEMRQQCQFKDWGEEHFEGRDPPYSSSAGPWEVTANEDEFVDIYVVNTGKEGATKKRVLEQAEANNPPKKARVQPAAAAESLNVRRFGPTKKAIKADEGIFARNPCRIAGGTVHPPSSYPDSQSGMDSFQYLVQRISDRNYAMRAFCLDGAGATYNSFKKTNVTNRSVVWMPPANLNDFAKDESIVDAVHLDLINPFSGKCQLTPHNLQAATGPNVRCLFLNGYQDNSYANFEAEPDAIPSAVRACPNLECIALSECLLTKDVLKALASCSNLKGLILDMMQVKKGATDEGLAGVLRGCPKLSWLFVTCDVFGDRCWAELARDGALPNLEVLWVDSTTSGGGMYGIARGDHSIIETALTVRSSALKICMINPDEKLQSRYVIGGARRTNRLKGDELAPMPSFEDFVGGYGDYEVHLAWSSFACNWCFESP